MARESRSLAAIIREHSGGKRVEPPDKLFMRAQVDSIGGVGCFCTAVMLGRYIAQLETSALAGAKRCLKFARAWVM